MTITDVIIKTAKDSYHKMICANPNQYTKYVSLAMIGKYVDLNRQSNIYSSSTDPMSLMLKLMTNTNYSICRQLREDIIAVIFDDDMVGKNLHQFFKYVAESSTHLPKLIEKDKVNDEILTRFTNVLEGFKNMFSQEMAELNSRANQIVAMSVSSQEVESIAGRIAIEILKDAGLPDISTEWATCGGCGKFKKLHHYSDIMKEKYCSTECMNKMEPF